MVARMELSDYSTFAVERIAKLSEPFSADKISWRVGARTSDKTKGIALAYIDARDVMRRLDEVMGADWQCRYSHVTDHGVVCEIGLFFGDEWRWRANGAGETDVEGEKGAMSDAFKRAAVLWGVGRYLYDLPNVWCPLKNDGKFLAETPILPAWALPGHEVPPGSNALGPLMKALEANDAWAMLELATKNQDAFRQAFSRLGSNQKKLCRELEQTAAAHCHEYAEGFTEYHQNQDVMGAQQFIADLTSDTAKRLVWARLDSTVKHWLKGIKDGNS